ncbi:hypothetical protein F2Q69_00046361 [Brassica cretica]|uniref:Uncharacterized protein n=1 Tax=Brassica cretica TaxID=69181 RepID=A0A8S9PRF5_BRACR|nr:hypothetical protein F2Q69_00046361 [Brassica cretica]
MKSKSEAHASPSSAQPTVLRENQWVRSVAEPSTSSSLLTKEAKTTTRLTGVPEPPCHDERTKKGLGYLILDPTPQIRDKKPEPNPKTTALVTIA